MPERRQLTPTRFPSPASVFSRVHHLRPAAAQPSKLPAGLARAEGPGCSSESESIKSMTIDALLWTDSRARLLRCITTQAPRVSPLTASGLQWAPVKRRLPPCRAGAVAAAARAASVRQELVTVRHHLCRQTTQQRTRVARGRTKLSCSSNRNSRTKSRLKGHREHGTLRPRSNRI